MYPMPFHQVIEDQDEQELALPTQGGDLAGFLEALAATRPAPGALRNTGIGDVIQHTAFPVVWDLAPVTEAQKQMEAIERNLYTVPSDPTKPWPTSAWELPPVTGAVEHARGVYEAAVAALPPGVTPPPPPPNGLVADFPALEQPGIIDRIKDSPLALLALGFLGVRLLTK